MSSTCSVNDGLPREKLSNNLAKPDRSEVVVDARRRLETWIRVRDYQGYEPYDLLNSPALSGQWARRRPFNILLLQLGRRFAGEQLRHWLRVPPSTNPKALGLLLSAFCDLSREGEDWDQQAQSLKAELIRLRSPGEEFFCWGYDWDFYSLRGPAMTAFSPNAIATYFCGCGLLDVAQTFGDAEARTLAESVGEFFVKRLNRSVDSADQVCFSYTPSDRTIIYNSSALVGAFLARLSHASANVHYADLARRCMKFLAAAQHPDGSWSYGSKRRQHWVDSFHTAYNLCALLDYSRFSGDSSFESVLARGYNFYKQNLFSADGTPKYFSDAVYPVDIHSCSQAILTFCAFSNREVAALDDSLRTALWTIQNMQSPEGFFYFQRHRFWTNRTPYMRWGQAWMFRALANLELTLRGSIRR
jgi:hypothetical protein